LQQEVVLVIALTKSILHIWRNDYDMNVRTSECI
jgi:hypothetical protein